MDWGRRCLGLTAIRGDADGCQPCPYPRFRAAITCRHAVAGHLIRVRPARVVSAGWVGEAAFSRHVLRFGPRGVYARSAWVAEQRAVSAHVIVL